MAPKKLTKKQLSFSIFRPTENMKSKEKRWKFIHYAFKARLFVPLMLLFERILKRYMVNKKEDIPNEPYNANFHVLWDAYEDAVKEWWFLFKRIEDVNRERDLLLIHQWVEREKHFWYRIPKFFLKLMMTICLEDTAYREQFNFVMFKLQGKMNAQWNPKIRHEFPLYMNKYEAYAPYFIEWMKKCGGGTVTISIKPTVGGTANGGQPKTDTRLAAKEFRELAAKLEEQAAKESGESKEDDKKVEGSKGNLSK